MPAIVAFVSILLIWQLVCVCELVPAYMLPSPVNVIKALIEDADLIVKHLTVTLKEAFLGLFIGIILAFAVATLMDNCKILYRAFYPILIITQTVPTVAIAPLLVLWMGFGMAPKVTLVVLTTFFPITVGLLDGYKNADKDQINMLKSMGAGRVKIFKYIKFPGALSHFFAGLKISVSYAVVGALIAEWLGGFEGLGVYMTRVKKAYAFDRMFAVIFVIVIISLLLMKLVEIIRKWVLPWEKYTKINE